MNKTILIALMVLSSLFAFGQQERYIPPTDLKQETFVANPITLRKGFLRTQFTYGFSNSKSYFDGDGKKTVFSDAAINNDNSFNLTLTYGITDRFEIRANLNYSHDIQQASEAVTFTQPMYKYVENVEHKTLGFGDSRIELGYQVVSEKKRSFSLATYFSVKIPTGKKNPENSNDYYNYSYPTGSGAYQITADLVFRKMIYPFSFDTRIGYSNTFKSTKKIFLAIPSVYSDEEYETDNPDYLSASASINFMLNDWVGIGNQFFYSYTNNLEAYGNNIDEKYSYKTYNLLYSPNLVVQIKRIRIQNYYYFPVTGKNSPVLKMIFIGVSYVF